MNQQQFFSLWPFVCRTTVRKDAWKIFFWLALYFSLFLSLSLSLSLLVRRLRHQVSSSKATRAKKNPSNRKTCSLKRKFEQMKCAYEPEVTFPKTVEIFGIQNILPPLSLSLSLSVSLCTWRRQVCVSIYTIK
jgi:hypothetical protein